MMTVKEVSKLTGISVRTLHYYDEIGLFSPTGKSEAGYRLYDDKALEVLQQILFFREFDISLKEIRSIMQDPAFDKSKILEAQRKMLVAKKERIERLILSIDGILKGENKMDFVVFGRTKAEELFRRMYERMPEDIRQTAVEEFGSAEEWKKRYMEVILSEDMQKKYAEVFGLYGGMEGYMSASEQPLDRNMAQRYKERIEEIFQALSEKRSCPPDSAEVRELIGEYAAVMKEFTKVQDEAGAMKYLAMYQDTEPTKSKTDRQYGEGTAHFIAQAIEMFYEEQS